MSGSFVVTTNPRACAVLQDLPGSTRKRKITSKMIRPSTRVDITWDCMETVLMNELAFATLDGVPSQFHAQWWIYEYVTNMRNHVIIKSSVCRSGGFSGFHTISNWMHGDVRVAQGPLLGLIFRGDLAGKMVHWVANPLRLSVTDHAMAMLTLILFRNPAEMIRWIQMKNFMQFFEMWASQRGANPRATSWSFVICISRALDSPGLRQGNQS